MPTSFDVIVNILALHGLDAIRHDKTSWKTHKVDGTSPKIRRKNKHQDYSAVSNITYTAKDGTHLSSYLSLARELLRLSGVYTYVDDLLLVI